MNRDDFNPSWTEILLELTKPETLIGLAGGTVLKLEAARDLLSDEHTSTLERLKIIAGLAALGGTAVTFIVAVGGGASVYLKVDELIHDSQLKKALLNLKLRLHG